MKQLALYLTPLFLLGWSCQGGKTEFDATGTFEATEVIVSSATAGRLVQFTLREGDTLALNGVVATVDTTQLHLKKQQLEAQVRAVLSRQPDIPAQLAALQEQIRTAQSEQQRAANLVKAGVAPEKQLDDITNQLAVLEKQMNAQQSVLQQTTGSLYAEVEPLTRQIAQVDDQLMQSRVLNPLAGTVLVKYAEAGEYVAPGKALYKIGDLAHMELRAYITGEQLPMVRLGQQVTVKVDAGGDRYTDHTGKVVWIAEKAEFTPKSIMTREERSNLVYAVRIAVPNDGSLKIGMYGEVVFQ